MHFFSLWTFSQSWYMLLRHMTYQHDPQGILINFDINDNASCDSHVIIMTIIATRFLETVRHSISTKVGVKI